MIRDVNIVEQVNLVYGIKHLSIFLDCFFLLVYGIFGLEIKQRGDHVFILFDHLSCFRNLALFRIGYHLIS